MMLSGQMMVWGVCRMRLLPRCIPLSPCQNHETRSHAVLTLPGTVLPPALNQEPKGKGKPGPALSHAQSRFLGRVEGRAERSISCSVASPRTPPQPPLLPSQLIDMRLGIQSHFWLPESKFHTTQQKVKNVHFWTELSLRNRDKVTA